MSRMGYIPPDRAAEQAERWRQHSVTLNRVGWRLAMALGDIPEDAVRHDGDVLADVDRLIAERDRWRDLARGES